MKAADRDDLLRGPTLVVSAEGSRLGVGRLVEGAWEALAEGEGTAVEQLPGLAREVAGAGGGEAPRHWVYSGGPGTLLGLRFTSLFLHTWARALPDAGEEAPAQPQAHRFSGLVWTAREAWRADPRPFLLLHRWRRGAWNALAVRGPQPAEADLFVAEGAPESLPAGDLRREVLLRAEARPSVAGADVVSLPPFPTLRDHLGTPGFLVPTRGFPLLQAGSTHYLKWTGGIHGAAPAR